MTHPDPVGALRELTTAWRTKALCEREEGWKGYADFIDEHASSVEAHIAALEERDARVRASLCRIANELTGDWSVEDVRRAQTIARNALTALSPEGES